MKNSRQRHTVLTTSYKANATQFWHRVKPTFADDPYLRQRDFFSPGRHDPRVAIVGAGGIGSWVAVQLAKLGVMHITVFDHDRVAPHNLSTTVYRPSDIGKPKVLALAQTIRRLGLPARIDARPVLYRGQSLRKFDIVISAVDSMAGRTQLFREAKRQRVPFYIDGRIGGENLRVYAVRPSRRKDARLYRATIVPDDQASELPCTAQQIFDTNGMTSSLIVRAVRKWTVERVYTPELITTMQTLQFVVAPPQGGKQHGIRKRTHAGIRASKTARDRKRDGPQD